MSDEPSAIPPAPEGPRAPTEQNRAPAAAGGPDATDITDVTDTAAAADPLVAVLRTAVSGHRVRRVPLMVLRAAFAGHDPTGATSSDSRERLAAALTDLADAGVVTLPKAKRLFEAHLLPRLPLWVERPAAARPAFVARPQRIWRPELTAAAAAAKSAEDFDVLTRVDDFLRGGGAGRPVVPHRERSVELFGHEKRLDTLLKTKLFTTGALNLPLLRCYQPPLPLTAQHTGDPGPRPQLLIVENHATYASVLTLARARASTGAPALAVGWGAGKQLPSAIGGAVQLAPAPAAIWYFGDLDEDGLRIAIAATAAAQQERLPQMRPAVPLYRELLARAPRQPGQRAVPEPEARILVDWLADVNLQQQAVDVLMSGFRLAQESVGYEQLEQMSSWTS